MKTTDNVRGSVIKIFSFEMNPFWVQQIGFEAYLSIWSTIIINQRKCISQKLGSFSFSQNENQNFGSIVAKSVLKYCKHPYNWKSV